MSNSNGVSFLGILTLLFIALKLTHYIQWSWLWILSPLWIPVAVMAFILVLYLIFQAIAKCKSLKRLRR